AEDELPFVRLQAGEKSWLVSSRSLGGYLDLDQAVQQAWQIGRSGSFLDDMLTRLRLFWYGYQIIPPFHLERGPALVTLRYVARQASYPVRHAQLWISGLQAHTGKSHSGRELDIPATREAIEKAIQKALGSSSWNSTPRLQNLLFPKSRSHFPTEPISVALAFREIAPPLTEVEGAKERIEIALRAPLILTTTLPLIEPDGNIQDVPYCWAIDQATISSWLALHRAQESKAASFQVAIEHAKLRAWLSKLAEQLACPPREPRFDYTPQENALTLLTPGQNGYALDIATAEQLIAQACFDPIKKIPLPLHIIPPRVTRAELASLLPLQLVGEGESSFRGSKPGRLQNIKVASARFYGLIVPPGAIFSFLQNLGLVTVANGYSQSWIIYGDRTILGPGGGVCQVSTTCFRAAFWGGYPIIERWPHTYRVRWYEPPLGLDAAVFSPSTDFKFLNDTEFPILILTQVDEKNAKLYFRFYSRSIGRQVKMEGPTTSNPVKPGEPVYEQDPTLPPGTRIQVEWPHDGLDVTLYRIIEKNGQIVAKEKFFSRYEPWPARYLIGAPKQGEPPPES
ncbi:MAG: VanW family protein, partial [Anaerolineae bacterium]|nr:VanW family protein [Anaerolineae bacterium]